MNFLKYFRYFGRIIVIHLFLILNVLGNFVVEMFDFFGKKMFGVYRNIRKNGPDFEQSRCIFLDKESGNIYLFVYRLKFCFICREFDDARSCESRPIVMINGVLPNIFGEISSVLFILRIFSDRLNCPFRRPPFADSLA